MGGPGFLGEVGEEGGSAEEPRGRRTNGARSLANGNQRSRGWALTSQNATCQFVPFHSWATPPLPTPLLPPTDLSALALSRGIGLSCGGGGGGGALLGNVNMTVCVCVCMCRGGWCSSAAALSAFSPQDPPTLKKGPSSNLC